MPAHPIFVAGTASHVGKSWVATAICRYLFRRGFRVAPFKAQNMSNNSMACRSGGEIGRSQASQAAACGIQPHRDMNPILLKPSGSVGSQLVLNGKPWRNVRGMDYDGHFDYLRERVLESYRRLAGDFEYIVVEGAGGISELNLKRSDLVNLGLASRIDAPVLLVADIDRGGVFASVVGTFGLLEPGETELVRSFLINRFRGNPRLFADGVRILEEKTGRPCLGVFPYAGDIHLDPEDGVSLDAVDGPPDSDRVGGVAVVGLPHISNFTDFRLLGSVPYLRSVPRDMRFDTVFLPGTKSPIEDMVWLRSTGLADWILGLHGQGTRVIGVCGGFQMMGEEISDPEHLESQTSSVAGLGILPVRTRIGREKTTRPVRATTPSGVDFEAYEIHLGRTEVETGAQPFAILENGAPDGVRRGNAVGTYLHGALENPDVLAELIQRPVARTTTAEMHYDRLAEWFASAVDLDAFERLYLPAN